MIPALGSMLCVCLCVCVSRESSATSADPTTFERVWCKGYKPDCLGLNSQLYHLLAV